jgi:prophage antirepressor-like protein
MNTVAKQESNVIPFKFHSSQVRVMADNQGEPWFSAGDVCKSIENKNPSSAIKALDEDERSKFNLGRQGEAWFVNESGLFALILRSRNAMKPGTVQHKFRKWVTSEVLPAIRKTGKYEKELETLTKQQYGHINQAVMDLCKDGKNSYQSMFGGLKRKFSVASYKDIPRSKYAAACQFLGIEPKVFDGEAEEPKSLPTNPSSLRGRSMIHRFGYDGEESITILRPCEFITSEDNLLDRVVEPGEFEDSYLRELAYAVSCALVNKAGMYRKHRREMKGKLRAS